MPFDKLPCSQTRILNERYAIFAIVIGLLLPYMNIGINLFLNEFHGKLMKSCLDLPRDEVDFQNDLKISMLHGSLTLMSIALTLVCDIKMLVFVKNRNKTEPLELVPWKSTNNSNQENEDFQVPLKATTLTVVFLILFCVFFIVIFINDELWLSLTTMVIVIGILPLPLLLIFTVKQKDTTKSKCVQPPKTLQFHENMSNPLQYHESTDFDDQENGNNNVVVQVNPSFLPNAIEEINSF